MLDEDYLQDNLYSSVMNKPIRSEEQLIQRIIKQYNNPKIKLTQELNYKPILPFSLFTDQFVKDKIFSLTGGEIEFNQDRMILNLVENVKE